MAEIQAMSFYGNSIVWYGTPESVLLHFMTDKMRADVEVGGVSYPQQRMFYRIDSVTYTQSTVLGTQQSRDIA
jgi:hypothetical protein